MIALDHLPNHRHGEEVKLFLRRHWIVLVQIFLLFIFLLALPFLVIGLFSMSGLAVFTHAFWSPFLAVMLCVYLIFVVLITMTEFTDYYLDSWIVTNERILNTEHKGLFSRVISELYLQQVEDVTSEMHGVLPFFLTYGQVHIQTAATRERFEFKQVDNPDDVKREVIRLSQACKKRHHLLTRK